MDQSPIVRSFAGAKPRVHSEAWLAPGCVVVGDVEIGPESTVWFGAVLRGDVHSISVGARTNLQDHVVVHVTQGRFPCVIGDEVTVGHRAVVHGCRVEDGALVGIGACVLDGAVVGEGSLVAAGALVTPGTRIPPGVLALGAPARVVRPLSDQERRDQLQRALTYIETARTHSESEALGEDMIRT